MGQGKDAAMLLIIFTGFFFVIPSQETAGRTPHPESPVVASQNPSTSEIRKELLDLLSAERASRGLPALRPSEELDALALSHSQDMTTRGLLTHESSTGKTYVERLVGKGVYFQVAGENVASSETFVASYIHKAFMDNPGHRANILNPEFDQVGIGVSSDEGRFYYITQDFLHSFAPQNQDTVRAETRQLIGRILAGRKLPALGALPAWDDLADALAQAKAEGKTRPRLTASLGSVRVFFITTASLETATSQFQAAVIGPYAGASVGIALCRDAAHPGGAYVVALLLFIKE
jgi:uncharacterized protein YkwD